MPTRGGRASRDRLGWENGVGKGGCSHEKGVGRKKPKLQQSDSSCALAEENSPLPSHWPAGEGDNSLTSLLLPFDVLLVSPLVNPNFTEGKKPR